MRFYSLSILPSLIKALNRRKSLIIAISRGGDPSSRLLRIIVLRILSADWPLVFESLAFKGSVSIETIHLLNTIRSFSLEVKRLLFYTHFS